MNGQFLIAKYVGDLERHEPRNIGVIVWTKGAVATRFVESDSAEFVDDPSNFKRWVAYWQELSSQTRIQLFNDPPATIRSPRFLKALQKSQKGNYLLEVGGDVIDEVTSSNVQQAADFLFERIVAPIRTSPEDREPTLTDKCLALLREVGIALRTDFKRRFPVTLQFDGFQQEIHFDFGTGTGRPASLYNKVNLAKEDSITLAAGKCQTTIAQGICAKGQCFSLYDSEAEGDLSDSAVQFLGTFSVPLDISNEAAAKQLLATAL